MKKLFGLIITLVLFSTGCAALVGLTSTKPTLHDQKIHWKTVDAYDLVRYRVSDLGLDAPAALSAVHLAARRQGLGLCPESLGIPIRLAYPEQSVGEELFVGMKPVVEKKRGAIIYGIRVWDKQTSLIAVKIEAGKRFDPRAEFIFIKVKR